MIGPSLPLITDFCQTRFGFMEIRTMLMLTVMPTVMPIMAKRTAMDPMRMLTLTRMIC